MLNGSSYTQESICFHLYFHRTTISIHPPWIRDTGSDRQNLSLWPALVWCARSAHTTQHCTNTTLIHPGTMEVGEKGGISVDTDSCSGGWFYPKLSILCFADSGLTGAEESFHYQVWDWRDPNQSFLSLRLRRLLQPHARVLCHWHLSLVIVADSQLCFGLLRFFTSPHPENERWSAKF